MNGAVSVMGVVLTGVLGLTRCGGTDQPPRVPPGAIHCPPDCPPSTTPPTLDGTYSGLLTRTLAYCTAGAPVGPDQYAAKWTLDSAARTATSIGWECGPMGLDFSGTVVAIRATDCQPRLVDGVEVHEQVESGQVGVTPFDGIDIVMRTVITAPAPGGGVASRCGYSYGGLLTKQ